MTDTPAVPATPTVGQTPLSPGGAQPGSNLTYTSDPVVGGDSAVGGDSVGSDTVGGTDTVGADTVGSDTTSSSDTSGADSTSDTTSSTTDAIDPKSYDALTLPDGVTVDETLLGQFKAEAAKAKLDPAAAQQFLDLYTNSLKSQQEAQLADSNALVESWKTEVLSTFPEFQGQAKREQSEAVIAKLMEEFDPSGNVRKYMAETGLGNNPSVVRMFLDVANQLTEGNPTPSGKPIGQSDRTPGRLSYPNTKA